MTGLLISVRNKAEAKTVLAACPELDILDIKEPDSGALGAASPQIWREIGEASLNQTSLSIALGEINDVQINDLTLLPSVTRYVKVGLANQRSLDWVLPWRAIRVLVDDSIELVGVIYADHEAAHSPPPRVIIDALIAEGCRTFLLDTFEKDGKTLFDHLPTDFIQELMKSTPEATFVLAGSLTESTLNNAKILQADYVGVRGAVCSGNRTNSICPDKSKQLFELVKAS